MKSHMWQFIHEIRSKMFGFVVALVCASGVFADAAANPAYFFEMVRTLALAPQLNCQTVERIAGVSLSPMSPPPGDNPYARRFRARGTILDDVTISFVDYYDKPTYGNDFGAKVTITVDGKCVTESDVRSYFPNVEKLYVTPSGISLHQRTGMITIDFAFFEPPGSCLSAVTVERIAWTPTPNSAPQ